MNYEHVLFILTVLVLNYILIYHILSEEEVSGRYGQYVIVSINIIAYYIQDYLIRPYFSKTSLDFVE